MDPIETPTNEPPANEPPANEPPANEPPDKQGLFDEIEEPLEKNSLGDEVQRPDDIPEKYWDKEAGEVKIQDILKSEETWRKRYNEKALDESPVLDSLDDFTKSLSNEAGELITETELTNLGDEPGVIPADDPLIQSLLKNSAEAVLTEGQTKKLLNGILTDMNEMQASESYDSKVQMAKLGEHAEARISQAKLHVDALKVSDSQRKALSQFVNSSAENLMTFESILGNQGLIEVAPGNPETANTQSEDRARWEQLGADPQALDESASLRAEYEALGEKLYPG